MPLLFNQYCSQDALNLLCCELVSGCGFRGLVLITGNRLLPKNYEIFSLLVKKFDNYISYLITKLCTTIILWVMINIAHRVVNKH